MKFFWEEQQKYLNVSFKTSLRQHPMIIWYCLALQAKSAAAYYKDFEIIKIISI